MYRLLEPLPEKRIPLEKMTDEPWFQIGAPNMSIDPTFDQETHIFPERQIEQEGADVVPQSSETVKETVAPAQEQTVVQTIVKSIGEIKNVWSKTRQLASSSQTVRKTTKNDDAKSAKSGK